MAYKDENGSYAFPGLITGGRSIVSLTDIESISSMAKEILKEGTPDYHVATDEMDFIHSCLAIGRNGDTGMCEPCVININDGDLFVTDTKSAMRTGLRPTLTIDGSLIEYGIHKGAKVYDPECRRLGEWIAVSDCELVNCDGTFGTLSLLGDGDSVVARAKDQMHDKVKDEMERAALQSKYRDLNATLEEKGLDFYIDEEEKSSILNDLRSGWKLADEVERVGGAKRVAEKVRETSLEFAEEFKTHATKFSNLVKGFGSRVKDFFKANKEDIISTDDMAGKGIDEETATAIFNEAEKRQESKFSLKKLGILARNKIKDIQEKGIYALAGIAKSMSELKIDHLERMQAKEEKHISQALDKIKKHAEREHNAKEAEQRLMAFVHNVGRVAGNVGIAALNAGLYVATGSLTAKLAGQEAKFDGIPFRPMLEGKDINVTRSAFSTNLYKSNDNRIIDSALSLGQIKAKLFHERIASVPMAEREQTADRLIGEAAENLGIAQLSDRKIDYVNIEGFPGKHVNHTLEFTKDGLVVDGNNLTEKGYAGISRIMSPNALVHLFVEAEKENIIAAYKDAELVTSDLVQNLNKTGERTSMDMGDNMEQSENAFAAKSDINKTAYESKKLLNGEYTYADVLADKEAKEGGNPAYDDAAYGVEI